MSILAFMELGKAANRATPIAETNLALVVAAVVATAVLIALVAHRRIHTRRAATA